jgi:NCS2 family nucleobase:cation symporter-2
MFGATFLVPILTGFPVTTTLFFSGVGTILFLLLTRNKLPSYLGSSFAFIAPIQAYNGGKTLETTAQITQAMVSVAVTGVLLALVGLIVQKVGTRWIEKLMPPVVSGAIVALIGLNLAPAAWNNFTLQPVSRRSRSPRSSCSACCSAASSAASRSSSASSSATSWLP